MPLPSWDLLFLHFKIYFIFYLCVCGWRMCGCAFRGQRRVLDPLELLTGGYRPPDMGAGNRTLVLRKSSKYPHLLWCLSLQPQEMPHDFNTNGSYSRCCRNKMEWAALSCPTLPFCGMLFCCFQMISHLLARSTNRKDTLLHRPLRFYCLSIFLCTFSASSPTDPGSLPIPVSDLVVW